MFITQKHKNNRALQLNRKGFRPSIRRKRYTIQPKDLVWIAGERLIVSGTSDKGKYVVIIGSKKSYSVDLIGRVYHFGTFIFKGF